MHKRKTNIFLPIKGEKSIESEMRIFLRKLSSLTRFASYKKQQKHIKDTTIRKEEKYRLARFFKKQNKLNKNH